MSQEFTANYDSAFIRACKSLLLFHAPKIILIPNIFREKIHRIKLPFTTTIVHRPKSTLPHFL
jgi:hypothetical protein